MDPEKSHVQQAMAGRPVASWASIFLYYFDSKARLLAVESREGDRSFHLASSTAWGDALSSSVQCPYVWGVSLVFSCPPLSSGLGLECLDLRCDPYPS